MSHGSNEKCEPNLTPLLDLVLQLVMFFMLVANFVMEQSSEQIRLPAANAAKLLDKSEDSTFFLNVNSDGTVLLTPNQRFGGDEQLENAAQVQRYMEARALEDKRKNNKDAPQATLILRVDKDTRFEKTYQIMKACRLAGYQKVQLRVLRGEEQQGG